MRIIHLNSAGCDITDHEEAEVREGETPFDAMIRYLEELGEHCVDAGDTFKIAED
jgi:hypothetical protein